MKFSKIVASIKAFFAKVVAFVKGLFTKKPVATPAPVVATPVGTTPVTPASTPVVSSPTAAVGYVDPQHALTIVLDPSIGQEAILANLAAYPAGTRFVTPTGVEYDTRGVPVTNGFAQANQGG